VAEGNNLPPMPFHKVLNDNSPYNEAGKGIFSEGRAA